MIAFNPHDLIWIDCKKIITLSNLPCGFATLPDWVINNKGPVVVRRERTSTKHLIPIGVRGVLKEQRLAGYVDKLIIQKHITPYQITEESSWSTHKLLEHHPVLRTLSKISGLLHATEFKWGPTGSCAYELATGSTTMTKDSDLDLVINMPTELHRNDARRLFNELQSITECRLDIQLETPKGAIALKEWSTRDSKVLVKTNTGPFLVKNPWEEDQYEISQ
ncbi:MAG: malonate decarboxylase holo-ACP synthase [Neptuniibacter sp.]